LLQHPIRVPDASAPWRAGVFSGIRQNARRSSFANAASMIPISELCRKSDGWSTESSGAPAAPKNRHSGRNEAENRDPEVFEIT